MMDKNILLAKKGQLLEFWKAMNVSAEILYAFEVIPREQFLLPQYLEHAYDDHPLPTLRKQSISQPSTIIMMLQALDVKPGEKIFELGSGVGYQAALLSKLVGNGKVITTEVVPELVQQSKQNLATLNITNVLVLETDGSEGYIQEAPYDKIIITAACPTIPPPLITQLRENGIIIAPVGDIESQTMVKGIKIKGKLELEFLGPFTFVPMKGKHGFKEVDMYYE